MRKLVIALALAGLTTTAAVAQDYQAVPAKKYSVATNSFWANWYVSAGVNYHAAYSSQEGGLNKNPFASRRGQFGFDVAVGKWFTPSIGLRTKFEAFRSKQVNGESNNPSFDYWNLHEDVTFNLSNMLFGYNEKRVWNFIPYVGIGVARSMSYDNYDISYNAGLLNNFRVSKHFAIHADLFINAVEGTHDGIGRNNTGENSALVEKNKHGHWDSKVGLSLGVTYNLGKCTWEKAPDVDALMAMNKEQMDALNASLKEQQDENARLRELLSQQKPSENTVSKELVATSQSVFFNIGSSKIASRKDLVNVKEVAEYAKANNTKILVTGYADSKTGSKAFNQKLSEKRAQAVANELVKMGVSRDNLIIEGKGGVDNISPFSYNRRVTVKLQ